MYERAGRVILTHRSVRSFVRALIRFAKGLIEEHWIYHSHPAEEKKKKEDTKRITKELAERSTVR